MQSTQFRSLALDHRIGIAIVVTVSLKRRKKLQWRHNTVRLYREDARRLVPHDTILFIVHQIDRHLSQRFAQSFQASKIRNL